jgi:hypothetical protein
MLLPKIFPRDDGLPETPEARPYYTAPSPRNATRGEPSRRREASYKATDDGRPRMIRIERHEEVRPGVWRYTVPAFGIEGRSRIPPLDACTASDPWCAASLRAHGLGT